MGPPRSPFCTRGCTARTWGLRRTESGGHPAAHLAPPRTCEGTSACPCRPSGAPRSFPAPASAPPARLRACVSVSPGWRHGQKRCPVTSSSRQRDSPTPRSVDRVCAGRAGGQVACWNHCWSRALPRHIRGQPAPKPVVGEETCVPHRSVGSSPRLQHLRVGCWLYDDGFVVVHARGPHVRRRSSPA